MILDFNLKNYRCTYYSGKTLINEHCFYQGCVYGIYNNESYVTYVWSCNQNQLNYCFLDQESLINYFSEIAKLAGFDLLSFSKTKKNFYLQIKCIPNRRYFIYISMLIRYVYEYPFSILLHAAWQNKKNLPELNIMCIMQFYLALFFNQRYCHCPGREGNALYNISIKNCFSLMPHSFNESSIFLFLESKYRTLCSNLYKFNIKQLPQIINGLNYIANKYYDKYKKRICCW